MLSLNLSRKANNTMEATNALTPAAARDHLRAVIDPEIYQNIIDLGLVYDVNVDDANAVDVKMTFTSFDARRARK